MRSPPLRQRESFPLPSQECKDARKYQEKGHYTGDNKQQEFTEEVWFHQLVSTHGPTLSAFPILSQLARKHDPVIPSIRGPNAGEYKAKFWTAWTTARKRMIGRGSDSHRHTCRQQTP